MRGGGGASTSVVATEHARQAGPRNVLRFGRLTIWSRSDITWSRSAMPHAEDAESMLRYTTIQFGVPSTDTADIGHVDNAEAAITLIRSVDWRNVMGAWHETQEGPLPAIVFQAPAAKAELRVSHVPMDAAPYDQLHFVQIEKTGWLRSRKITVTAEVHSQSLLAQCLAEWEAGRWESLVQLLRDQGVNVLD